MEKNSIYRKKSMEHTGGVKKWDYRCIRQNFKIFCFVWILSKKKKTSKYFWNIWKKKSKNQIKKNKKTLNLLKIVEKMFIFLFSKMFLLTLYIWYLHIYLVKHLSYLIPIYILICSYLSLLTFLFYSAGLLN